MMMMMTLKIFSQHALLRLCTAKPFTIVIQQILYCSTPADVHSKEVSACTSKVHSNKRLVLMNKE